MRYLILIVALIIEPITTASYAKSKLSNDYEFIFFYSDNCHYCNNFTPVLKQYAADSGIAIKSISIDSAATKKTIDQFFGVGAQIAVPTLFILNKNNYHAYPVSSGALTYQELRARMINLEPKIIQYEK